MVSYTVAPNLSIAVSKVWNALDSYFLFSPFNYYYMIGICLVFGNGSEFRFMWETYFVFRRTNWTNKRTLKLWFIPCSRNLSIDHSIEWNDKNWLIDLRNLINWWTLTVFMHLSSEWQLKKIKINKNHLNNKKIKIKRNIVQSGNNFGTCSR